MSTPEGPYVVAVKDGEAGCPEWVERNGGSWRCSVGWNWCNVHGTYETRPASAPSPAPDATVVVPAELLDRLAATNWDAGPNPEQTTLDLLDLVRSAQQDSGGPGEWVRVTFEATQSDLHRLAHLATRATANGPEAAPAHEIDNALWNWPLKESHRATINRILVAVALGDQEVIDE